MSISYPTLGTPAVSASIVTTTAATTTNAVLLPANAARVPESLIVNNSNKNLWVTFTGSAAVASAPSIKIPALGGSMDIPGGYTGAVNGIWETGGAAISGSAVTYEFIYL